MWFDSHCHLHLCEEHGRRIDDLLARATEAGVLSMLSAGIDVESSTRAAEIASREGVYASAGVHPNSADDWSDAASSAIEDLLHVESVVAVGESGLDFYRDAVPPSAQRNAFAAHIDLAKTNDKALVIHTRDSVGDALAMLEEAGPPPRVVFHCWSGDEHHLKRALALDAYISFAGNVAFPKSESLRAAAAMVPQERVLVETDSPFLTPPPHRGKSNEPRNVAFVGAAVAQARDVSIHLLAEQTTQNARRLFAIR